LAANPAKARSAPRRRPGGRSARVREAVLAATVQELAAVGYSDLSLESVARRAGVHRTTLFRRWGSREALVLDLMLERASREVPVPDTGSLREDLLQLARRAVATASSPDIEAVVRAVLSGIRQDPELAEASNQFWDKRMSLDGAIVERAVARGEVAAGVNPRLVIETVLGPLHLRLLVSGNAPEEAEIAHVVDLVVDGVTRRRNDAA
jgi:AcrR family transcriptional regulator